MLRLLVLALIVVNIGFCSWRQGKLDDWVGARAMGDREPDRLARQVRPEAIRVIPAASAAAAARASIACLEAGPYTGEQVANAEGVLQTVLPVGSWVNVKTEIPGIWIIFMGRYTNPEDFQKKSDELRRRNVAFDEVRGVPGLDPGFSLGRFDSRAAADRALADVTQRGVRSARVETLSQPVVSYMLRVDRADATLQTRLAGLRAEALLGKTFSACPTRP